MSNSSHTLALAALRHWAAGASGGVAPLPEPDTAALLHRTAWLLTGVSAPDSSWPQLPDAPLTSIFSRIKGREATAPNPILTPQELRLDEAVLFPTTTPALYDPTAVKTGLQQALAELAQRNLPAEAEVEGLLYALQRYAWALPSPLPGVALYDFARSHAALAAALAADPTGAICLIGGDLSGVQEFIYSVSAKGATKQLRGRSLYLQLLTDGCAHAVLTAAGMPLCNLLYAGGGRFYVVGPGEVDANHIQKLRQQLSKVLLTAHHGELYLALGAVQFRPEQYETATWENLNQQVDQDKRRRFAALDQQAFANLFQPQQPPPPREDATEDEPLDAMADSLEQLGAKLQRADMLSVQPDKPLPLSDGERTCYDVLGALGLPTRLLADDQTYHANRNSRRRLLALADDASLKDHRLGPHDLIGLRYTAAEAPLANEADVQQYASMDRSRNDDQDLQINQIKPFNLLAAQSQGVTRLGVLRMDVDDLGELFGNRIERPTGMAGLVVTAALSAALSRFFEGWVGELCRQQNGHGEGGVIAVYSGGDDLFLVGSWHRMPGLARQIREDFAAYVLGRRLQPGEAPPISLSAGITLINAGYPLYQAADDAAEALDAAKSHTRPDKRHKDAINFLGRTLGWEHFGEAEALMQELQELIKAGGPRALLMSIQRIDASAHQAQRHTRSGEAQFAYGPWIWQGAYQLTRMAERAPKECKPTIEQMRERIVGSTGVQARTIERAGLAARWTQLLLREQSK